MDGQEVDFGKFHGFSLDDYSFWCACDDTHDLLVFVVSDTEMEILNEPWRLDGISEVITTVVKSDMTIIILNVVLVQKDANFISLEIICDVESRPVEPFWESSWVL